MHHTFDRWDPLGSFNALRLLSCGRGEVRIKAWRGKGSEEKDEGREREGKGEKGRGLGTHI